ncbi:MAG: hypothetical protein K8R53_13730, partial [Bacteroidales bacterium]|nr:hypothetical protein [Bacteroidales bacterium]
MKRLNYWGILIFLFSHSAIYPQSTWQKVNPIPPDAEYTNVFFTDSLHGWICGYDGILLRTKDGGSTWEYQQTPTLKDLNQVFFVDSLAGWIAGNYKISSKTVNGGEKWEKMSVLNPGQWTDFTSLYFINNDSGWIAGREIIYMTSDGGKTWEQQLYNSPAYSNIKKIIMVNSNTGFAITNRSVLFKTTNGGEMWETDTLNASGVVDNLMDLSFINDSTGWVATSNGKILFTETGGDLWDTVSLGISSDVHKVHFSDIDHGMAFSDHHFYKTSDGGFTWTYSELLTDCKVNGASFIDENHIWYVTTDNGIYYSHNGGITWNPIENSTLTEDIYSVCYLNPDTLFAVGYPSYILKSINAGQSWFSFQIPSNSFILYS